MQDELIVLRDVTSKLAQAGVEYTLTGSWALNYYAEPRMTRDIDIVIALEPKDANRLIELRAPEYYIPTDAARRAIADETVFNILHNQLIVKVDFNHPKKR
ncbi:MAG: hypothetical protein ABR607_11905 [Pyrinomonadaceae bacterium]